MSARRNQGADRPPAKLPDDERYLGYFVPAESLYRRDISFAQAGEAIRKEKWTIAGILVISIVLSILYTFFADEWYESSVLLAPADNDAEQSLLAGKLGTLGGLVGIGGIQGSVSDTSEAIAVLTSRDFVRQFIESNKLLPILYADEWDSEKEQWSSQSKKDPPDIREATRYFRENIQSVSQDLDTGLVTLTIEWQDPEQSSTWARELVEMANAHLRQRAMTEADANIGYLTSQLEATNLEALRETIVRLLETEMQKYMLARGNDEYAFRIIDSPEVPFEKSWPKPALIVIAGTILGFVAAILLVLFRLLLPGRIKGDEVLDE